MDLTVAVADFSERDVVEQLLELNAYEFSTFDARAMGSDGRYGYVYLDAYWSEAGRTPYLFHVRDELAGFALVRAVDDGEFALAEFLVLPKFRRSGIGTSAARQLFKHHRGGWSVEQVAGNHVATTFWRRAIPETFEEFLRSDGSVVQRFTT